MKRWSQFETAELVELGSLLWWAVPTIKNFEGKYELLEKLDKEIQDELVRREFDQNQRPESGRS